jgi:two-component SAPR family response regulator
MEHLAFPHVGPRQETKLHIHLFRGLDVSWGEDNVKPDAWRSQSARGLFALLLLRGPVHRERLIDMFWPDAPYPRARANLGSIVRYVRSALATVVPSGLEGMVAYDHGAYLFNPDVPYSADVHDFTRLIHEAEQLNAAPRKIELLKSALALYKGELLPGFYYDWVTQPRENLRQSYLEAGETLAQLCCQTGRHQEAVEVCRLVLEEDPTWEGAHRVLMQSYAAQGRRDQVARQYQRLRLVLQTHLDVAPSRQTDSLYRGLLASA